MALPGGNGRAHGSLHRLKQTAGALVPLSPELPLGVVPQSFPVVLCEASRDEVYQQMNDTGFGVVSLYHTLINAISPDAFPDSHWLARRILNLPVHQDATPEALEAMVTKLASVLGLRA
jgi:dTDP-4-amino-4,6-dideoxygalactose transaminase